MKDSISDWANHLPTLKHKGGMDTPSGAGSHHIPGINEANGLPLDASGVDSAGNPNGADLNECWSEAYWPDDA